MKYRAVIFDLDGTLIDTLRDLAEAANYTMGQLGCPAHPISSYRLKVGDGVRKLLERSLPSERGDLLDRALQINREYLQDHLVDYSRPYPGVPELLAQLKEKSLSLAVLSNKPDPLTQKVCAHFFPNGFFSEILGHREEMPLKPDPTSAHFVANRLGVAPEQVIYVGDTAIDMETANRAGMVAVGVSWGFRDRAELQAHGSQMVIDHPDELLTLLHG